jgi:hypothetical protein
MLLARFFAPAAVFKARMLASLRFSGAREMGTAIMKFPGKLAAGQRGAQAEELEGHAASVIVLNC